MLYLVIFSLVCIMVGMVNVIVNKIIMIIMYIVCFWLIFFWKGNMMMMYCLMVIINIVYVEMNIGIVNIGMMIWYNIGLNF